MPTVVIGSAKDIVEQCGVARFLFTDFPLGNPCGRPNDIAMQKTILEMGLSMFENVLYPRTTIQVPFVWNEADDISWRKSYMEIVFEEKVSRKRIS